ncbi:DUF998 domain-containing protein [Halobacteria archaeon HArc-gm2]|nr:DUF998 domain-containing protein [Halobacteria archaeon HArc-gm2]
MNGDVDRGRTIAGLALVGVGIVSTLGIVTAEALYPGYSTAEETISALGASIGPAGLVQPSATIFNGAMILSGLLTLVAADGIDRVYDRRWLTAIVALTGLGVAGVGIFPADQPAPHFAAAFLAFAGGGLSAIAAALVVRRPFSYLSAGLGVVALIALALFVALGGSTVLGIGGLERWITYPTQLWVTAFGGYLLGTGEHEP